MPFGHKHYVPVLKVKRGEKKALQGVATALRSSITPLLEIVERTESKTLSDHIATAFSGLASSVTGYPRCFIDVRELESDGATAAAAVFGKAAAEGILFTPVTGITRTADLTAAIAHSKRGLAIRLTRTELEKGLIPAGLPSFLSTHGLRHNQVDLVIDLGPVDPMIVPGVIALADTFLSAIPDHTRWRTFTLSACAFPLSMGSVQRDSHGLAERMEWQTWRNHLYTNRARLSRLPTYSDCAIQHTKGVEGFDPRTMQASAAIRYTLADHWLLIKGVGTRSTPPSQQFPGLATSLVSGRHRGSFLGAGHCEGCAGISAAAGGAAGFGSLELWRRLGTVHHVTIVAQALAALP